MILKNLKTIQKKIENIRDIYNRYYSELKYKY